MTLNSISWNFQWISWISDAIAVKRIKIGQYCQRQRCKHVESEQLWHAFASRGFVSDSWAFLLYNDASPHSTRPCNCAFLLTRPGINAFMRFMHLCTHAFYASWVFMHSHASTCTYALCDPHTHALYASMHFMHRMHLCIYVSMYFLSLCNYASMR